MRPLPDTRTTVVRYVRISRGDLAVMALLVIPGISIGAWLSTLIFGIPFSFHSVWDESWGALTFAALLSLIWVEPRGEA